MDYDDPVHAMRRDWRGALVLSAFLGNFDMRNDNTRLELEPVGNGYRLLGVLSDVGSGLGRAKHVWATTNSDSNSFTDSFVDENCERHGTSKAKMIAPSCKATGLPFDTYNTNQQNNVFAHVTKPDALWLARYLSQLSVEQFRVALKAAGFSPGEVDKFAYLLAARRDNLVRAVRLKVRMLVSPQLKQAHESAS